MNIVIGSGPAGVACAHALVSRGERVTIIDAGLELEPAVRQRVDRVGAQRPDTWGTAAFRLLGGSGRPDSNGMIRKLAHGSDFPYRAPDAAETLERDGVALVPSYARGGFSNVWGAAVLPFRKADFLDWPLNAEVMEPHYRDAMAMMPVSAVGDGLTPDFPLYSETSAALNIGEQGGGLLQHLDTHRERLAASGIRHGQARLAVQAERTNDRPGCVYCGQCLVGCPYGLIYNSADTLSDLLQETEVTYQSGLLAEEVREGAEGPRVLGRTVDGRSFERAARRVFIAAGVMNTTRILLRSSDRIGEPVRVQDSRYFLLPLLGRYPPGEKLHTLSLVFLRLAGSENSPHEVHLQLYGYNSMYGDAVRKALGPLERLLMPVARPLERRLLAIQGYLHSDLSPGIVLRLEKGADGFTLIAEAEDDGGQSDRVIRRIGHRLLRASPALGALPLLPLLRRGEPGRGFHSGGSFPMSARPGRTASDVAGRPPGYDRVHVVDATVLPSIPAGPITLSVMANARRIAHLATADDVRRG